MKKAILLALAVVGIATLSYAGNVTVQYNSAGTPGSVTPTQPTGRTTGLPCSISNGTSQSAQVKQVAVTVSAYLDGGASEDCIAHFGAYAYVFVPGLYQTDAGGGWVREPDLDLPELDYSTGLLCYKGVRQQVSAHANAYAVKNLVDGGSFALTQTWAPGGSVPSYFCPQGGRLYYSPYDYVTTDAGQPANTVTLEGLY